MSALTPQEAEDALVSAVSVLVALEDLERKPSSAVPRDVLNCGEAMVLLGSLVALISQDYPELVSTVPNAVDLASLNFRRVN